MRKILYILLSFIDYVLSPLVSALLALPLLLISELFTKNKKNSQQARSLTKNEIEMLITQWFSQHESRIKNVQKIQNKDGNLTITIIPQNENAATISFESEWQSNEFRLDMVSVLCNWR